MRRVCNPGNGSSRPIGKLTPGRGWKPSPCGGAKSEITFSENPSREWSFRKAKSTRSRQIDLAQNNRTSAIRFMAPVRRSLHRNGTSDLLTAGLKTAIVERTHGLVRRLPAGPINLEHLLKP